jgi:hypothetical protein
MANGNGNGNGNASASASLRVPSVNGWRKDLQLTAKPGPEHGHLDFATPIHGTG